MKHFKKKITIYLGCRIKKQFQQQQQKKNLPYIGYVLVPEDTCVSFSFNRNSDDEVEEVLR